jgi:hypothetical protein
MVNGGSGSHHDLQPISSFDLPCDAGAADVRRNVCRRGRLSRFRQMIFDFAKNDAVAPRAEFPLAVLMETDLGEASYTLMVAADGSMSLYTSTGGGIIGAGAHASVKEPSKAFLRLARNTGRCSRRRPTGPFRAVRKANSTLSRKALFLCRTSSTTGRASRHTLCTRSLFKRIKSSVKSGACHLNSMLANSPLSCNEADGHLGRQRQCQRIAIAPAMPRRVWAGPLCALTLPGILEPPGAAYAASARSWSRSA